MDKNKINEIISDFMANGYDMNAINQIHKALNNGFDAVADIEITVPAGDIRAINEAYMKYYHDSYDKETYQRQLLIAVNNRLPLDYIIDKKHEQSILSSIISDLKEGKDVSYYITPPDKRDLSSSKINMLKTLYSHDFFNGLTKEEIESVQNLDINSSNVNDLINCKKDGTLKSLLEVAIENKKNNFSECYLLNEIKTKYNEWYDKVKTLSPAYIATIFELIEDEEISNNLIKIKDYIHKFSAKDLEKIAKFKLDEKSESIIALNYSATTLIDILQKPEDFDLDLIKMLDSYNIQRTSTYILKELSSYIKEIDRMNALKQILNELENNDEARIEDIEEILLGLKSNIDINYYITDEEQEYPFGYTEKKYIRLVLEYNQKHSDKPINLDEIFDSSEKGINLYDSGNIEELIELLEADQDITPFIEMDSDMLSTIVYNREHYNFSNDQWKKLSDYQFLEPDEAETEFLMKIIEEGCEVLSQDDILRRSISIFKELNQMASFDEFSKKVIDEKLTEDNCVKLLECLKQYQSSTGLLKEICKFNIEQDKFIIMSEDVAKGMSPEQLDIIYGDLKYGVDPSRYASNSIPLEKMKIFSEMNRIIHDMKDGYTKTTLSDDIRKIYAKDFSIKQLEYIKERVKHGDSVSHYKPTQSLENMKFYDKCKSVFYIYDFEIYEKSKKANNRICDIIRSGYDKIDQTKPIEEKEKEFIAIQKKALEEAAEHVEIDMETKILIYDFIKKLEQAKEEKISDIEIQK